MTTARKLIVDSQVTPYCQCISRCVRRAFLCGDGNDHRKQWIEDRLQELTGIFGIDVCAYAIMDDHLQVLLRHDPARANSWSNREAAERWLTLCPPRDTHGKHVKLTPKLIVDKSNDAAWLLQCRQRLVDVGWFMKSLKEQISRRANREDGCTGAFWEGRFKSIAILDDASLLATCVSIDLSPFAAAIANTLKKTRHSSLAFRIDHYAAEGKLDRLSGGSPKVSKERLEQGRWLFPIEDKRNMQSKGLAGMLKGVSLKEYLELVEWSSRLIHPGKSRGAGKPPTILTKLQIDSLGWQATLEKLITSTKKVGAYFGGTDRLEEVALRQGRHFLKNLTGRNVTLRIGTDSASQIDPDA